MANFHYKAITGSGVTIRGVLDAPDRASAIRQLRAKGHYPISASENSGRSIRATLEQWVQSLSRPRQRSISVITQELASLLGAGLELDRALGILAGLSDAQPLRETLLAVRARVRDGATLADALAPEKVFSRFYVNMVRAGELGGSLEQTLRKLSDYLSRSMAIREAIGSALVYPIILMVTAAASVSIILMFVLPEFEPLFAEAGHSLPLATRIVMTAGDVLRRYWWLLLALGAAIGYLTVKAWHEPAQRMRIDARLLRLPIFGPLLTAIESERLCRTLGTLVANGVALPTALLIARDTLNNAVIADAVGRTAGSLREGESLAARLGRTKLFPAVTIDLIQIGEETGKLDEMLLRQADLDEQRIRHTVNRLIALLVPALTIFLGMVVAGLIASMLVAVLSINELALH